MSDLVVNVSKPGQSAQTNDPSKLLMQVKYPFIKLDQTNNVSFQNINILFNNNPPIPALNYPTYSVTYLTTPIYQFEHGYNYLPSIWAMSLNDWIAPDQTRFPSYQNGNVIPMGAVAGGINGGQSVAALWIHADATNIYIDVIKQITADNSGNLPTPLIDISGVSFKIRLYVFVDDLVTNS